MAKLTKEQQDLVLQKIGVKNSSDVEALDISFEDIDKFGDKESLKNMVNNIAKYNKMLGERITFVNESLTAAIPFTRENLYLMCAYTGSGKSTVAANISFPLWKQGKKVLVISNEEPEHDVLLRIACLDLGLNFNDFKKGQMPPDQLKSAVALFPQISEYVKIIDVNFKDGLTTKVEGVKKILEKFKDSNYSCILIDYYQLVKYSIADKSRKTYDILNDLRTFLGLYIKGANMPVVLFVQLYSQSKRPSKGSDLDTRIKECSSIVEPATVIIEIVPDRDAGTTDFIVHKDRFGIIAGHKIVCPFKNGRFLRALDERGLAEHRLEQLTKGVKDASTQGQSLVSDMQPQKSDVILASRPTNE